MGTELTPNAASLSLDLEYAGRPRENGLWVTGTDQLFYFGKRILSWDGKVYKYGHAKAQWLPGFLTANTFAVNKHITYAVLPYAIAIGDRMARVTVAASLGDLSTGFAKDELVGGTLVVGHNAASTGQAETHTIVANDAVATAGGTMRVWIDGAFSIAHSVTDGAEAYPNPYAYMAGYIAGVGNYDWHGFMGVANQKAAATYNGWTQTWGPCWVNPGAGSSATWGLAAGDRTAFAVAEGSVEDGTTLTASAPTPYRQRIGFTIDTTSGAVTAMPLIMLQISI